MKRYWKIIAISLLTVISITTYYGQKTIASQVNIEFKFETETGSVEELRDVIFYTDYSISDLYHFLQITTDGTESLSNESFLEFLLETTHDPNMEALIKEERNFMRKKNFDDHLYFEDEHVLAYADIKFLPIYYENIDYEFTFVIDVLDKKTSERTAFEITYSNNDFTNMYIEEVQVIDDELKAIVSANPVNEPVHFYLYTFDLNEKKLTDERLILTSEIDTGEHVYNRLLSPSNHFLEQPYAVFISYHGDLLPEGDYLSMAKKVDSLEYYLFDIHNGEIRSLNIHDEKEAIVSIEGSTLYLLKVGNDSVSIRSYNIESGTYSESFEFPVLNQSTALLEIYKGKLYGAYRAPNEENVASIFVGDVFDGKTLYEGKLRKQTNAEDSVFYINYIDFIY